MRPTKPIQPHTLRLRLAALGITLPYVAMGALLFNLKPEMAHAATNALGTANTPTSSAPQTRNDDDANHMDALYNKGLYWYQRYRYDLARQAFDKVLLMNPRHAASLRWQGLIDLNQGNPQQARLWLNKLQELYGNQNPNTRELHQAIELLTNKRQAFSELKLIATSDRKTADWPQKLRALFDSPPLGDTAVEYYRLLNEDKASRPWIRQQVQGLLAQFPNDKRYKKLANDLGLYSPANNLIAGSTNTRKSPTPKSKTNITSELATNSSGPASTNAPPNSPSNASSNKGLSDNQSGAESNNSTADNANTPSDFEKGQLLSDQAQILAQSGRIQEAIHLLTQAIALQPQYAWFRYDKAALINDQHQPDSPEKAQQVLQEGLALSPNNPEMYFANALLAAKQDRPQEALQLLNRVDKAEWTQGMSDLERRASYALYLEPIYAAERQGHWKALAQHLNSSNRWDQEPEIQTRRQIIQTRMSPKVQMGFEHANISGTTGVSAIQTQDIPLQIELPIDPDRTLFVRLDRLEARAGQTDRTATQFAQLGTTTATDPTIQNRLLTQNFHSQTIAVGMQTDQWRVDVGTTTGTAPINDWAGGVQWKQNINEGSLTLTLSRRMMSGSVLASTGAKDPLTGQSWGGARRNGIAATYYTPINDKTDFVGIARANLITGQHIPDNTELNLQGILSRTLYKQAGQQLEIGASLFLWSFDKNLRFYTWGQGGYYSPQSFTSLSLPITWSGRKNNWSWRTRLSAGYSHSKEDSTALYPLDPQLAQAAAAQGNATQIAASTGGGFSTSLSLQVEKQIFPSTIFGLFASIDRSEGYNPDLLNVYIKYAFDAPLQPDNPPSALTPWSRF